MSLTALQTLVQTRLTSHAYFAGSAYDPPRPISVLLEDMAEIDSAIEQAIASLGLLVLIKQPSFTIPDDFLTINANHELVVRIAENPTLNRDVENPEVSLQPCSDVATAVARQLHGWKPARDWDPIEVKFCGPQEVVGRQLYTVRATVRRVYLPL